jgi:hypothetical protein
MDHYETRTWRGWHHHMAQARQLVAHAIEQGLTDCPDLMTTLDYLQRRNHAAYRSHRNCTLNKYRQRSKSKRA